MADESARALLAAAYERLRADVLARVGTDLPADSPLIPALLKSLERLRERIADDDAWLEAVVHEIRDVAPNQ